MEGTTMGIYLSAPTRTLIETTASPRERSAYRSILDILQEMGNPELNPAIDQPAFVISKYFAPNRQEQRVTFRELHREIALMASVYHRLGLGEHSKIALAETNSKDFFGSYFGGLAVGACMVSVNLLALQDESSKTRYLTHMLGTPRLDAQAQAGADLYVFGTDSLFQKMYGLQKILKLKRFAPLRNFLRPCIERFAKEQAPRGLDSLVFKVLSKNAKSRKEKQDLQVLFERLPNHLKVLTPENRAQLMSEVRPVYRINQPFPAGKIAEVLYTSGTSGYPKGVTLSHGNLAFTVQSLTEGTEDIIRNQEVLLMGLPFFHIFGKAVMLATLSRQLEVARQGGMVQVIILPSLSKAIQNLDGVLKTLQEYQVTLLPAVPVFLEKMVQYLTLHPEKRSMFASVRTIISGGAALKPEIYDTLTEWFPGLRILEGYGSSEAGINLLNKAGTSGYVGFPLPGVEVRMVPLNGHSSVEESPETMPRKGELWIRSAGVSSGYVAGTTDSSDLTIAGQDGWFHSGDLVTYHPELGFKIIGRESFFIKIDNEKRSPGELEDAVKLAVPGIIDVFVVAHNPGVNEKAVAVAIIADTAVTEESIKKSMQQLAKDNLITRWKIPRHILVIHQENIPARFDQPFKREASYKVIRQFIQELLAASAIEFQEPLDRPRQSSTDIINPEAFNRILAQYNAL
jgi:acyl-CoA synthetase (AMP-forming)/AMP-acid ligase II